MGTSMRRLVWLPIILIGVSSIAFLQQACAGQDPTTATQGDGPTKEQIERIRADLGLDRPLLVQYAEWINELIGRGTAPQQAVDDNNGTRVEVQLVMLGIAIGTVFVLGTGAYLLRKKLGLVPPPPEEAAGGHH